MTWEEIASRPMTREEAIIVEQRWLSHRKVRDQMQIVIDIPESRYRLLQIQARTNLGKEKLDEFAEAVLNGTPLPKGHGRLIDADELFLDIQTDEQMRLGEHIAWVREKIEDASTIIEADSESEDGEK